MALSLLKSHHQDANLKAIYQTQPTGPNGEPIKPESRFAKVLSYAREVIEISPLEEMIV